MPNLLRKIFRPSRSRGPREPALDLLSSPTHASRGTGQSDIDDLTNLAQRVLGTSDRDVRSSKKSTSRKGKTQYLTDQVEDQLRKRAAADAVGTKSIMTDKRTKEKRIKKAKKAKEAVIVNDPVKAGRWVGDDGQKVMNAMIDSLEMVDQLQTDGLAGALSDKLLGRCTQLLEVQRDELRDVVVHMERGRYPALRTLRQVYERVLSGLTGLESLEHCAAGSELGTLVQLLEEGPDYLIDTFLIEIVIHHAEILDSTLAAEIREIYKKAVSHPGDLETFRRAGQGIVAYACAIPQEDLDDEMGREAYRTIGVLVKQLKLRVQGDGNQSRSVSREPSSTTTSSTKSILKVRDPVSPAPSSSDEEVEMLAGPAITSRFGTGPIIPSPAIPKPMMASAIGTPSEPIPVSRDKGKTKAPPDSPASTTSSLDSISLYDYRGQILTASALDLVLRQETLALADSTGQYTGEVSWDDVRKAWIPHWVVKLKPEDLAPREIPSTNPDDFEVRDEDEFGNKIGWTDTGEMYFEEEPTFELK